MDIYADIYFAINFSMDFICLYITCICMKTHVPPARLAFGSLIGGLFSVLSLIMPGNGIISVVITLGVGLFMCYAVFGGRGLFSRVIISFIIYIAVSFFMGGCLTFLYSFFNRYLPSLPASSPSSSLIFTASLICAAASLFLSRITNRFLKCKSARVTVYHSGMKLDIEAMVDSGNLLCDPISGLDVIILSHSVSLKLIPTGDFSPDALALNPSLYKRLRVIPARGVAGKGLLTAFIPDRLTVNGEEKKCLLALSEAASFGKLQALLPSSLLPV